MLGNSASVTNGVLLVGYFLSHFNRTEQVCEGLAVRLASAGHRVYTTSAKPRRFNRLVDMVATVWRQRHRYSAALVDIFSGPAFIWAEAVCRALHAAGKPYALTLRSGDLPAFARNWPGRVRRMLQAAEIVVAPSAYLQEAMRPYCATIRVLPNPVDAQACIPRIRKNVKARMVWARAFAETYNPSLAARIVAALASEWPDVQLTMVGPDKGDGSLQRMEHIAAELSVLSRITRAGLVPKRALPALLGTADIFLNTTRVDNTPVSVLEAMACGLCVITTNIGGIRYLVEHEWNGLLTAPDDAMGMSQAVRRVLTEPGLGERLSRNARATAVQFDWSLVLPQWEDLLACLAP